MHAKPLFDRLKKNPPSWSNKHTLAIKKIKLRIKEIPCLALSCPDAFKIVETSKIGYGGILKQRINNKEVIVRFTSGIWRNS